MSKKALVISGGGSKGAFAVGVLKYIHESVFPLQNFDVYCGTSTGSLIAPLASLGRLDILQNLYTTVTQKDIYKLGGIAKLLTDVSLHDATPLKKLIEKTLSKSLFDQIVQQQKSICLATVCLQNERLVYWTTQPTQSVAAYDVQPIQSLADLQRAMLASSCQPVFMQPVEVTPGSGIQYVDGGVRETTPLPIAMNLGATEVISISLSPNEVPFQNGKITSGLDMLTRTIDMFSQDVGDNDYALPNWTVQMNQYLDQIKDRLTAQGLNSAQIKNILADNPLKNQPLRRIWEIRPDQALSEGGEGGLNFDPTAMKGMLQKGFNKAKAFFENNNTPVFV
jgi:NTE family protein